MTLCGICRRCAIKAVALVSKVADRYGQPSLRICTRQYLPRRLMLAIHPPCSDEFQTRQTGAVPNSRYGTPCCYRGFASTRGFFVHRSGRVFLCHPSVSVVFIPTFYSITCCFIWFRFRDSNPGHVDHDSVKYLFIINRLSMNIQHFQSFSQLPIPAVSRYFPTSLGQNLGADLGGPEAGPISQSAVT